MKKSVAIISAVVALGAGAAGAVQWQKSSAQRAAIVAAVPARPDLSHLPAEFSHRLVAAEEVARNGPDRQEGLAELSELYHANGFYPEAIRCYRVLVQIAPSNPQWLHRWAMLVANYGESADAVTLWRRAEKLDGRYLPLRIHLADALLKLNRIEEAAAEYNAVLKQDGDNGYARLGLARIATAQGRWEDAKALLEPVAHGSNVAIGSDLLVTVYDHLGLKAQADALRGQNKAAGAFVDTPDPWMDALNDACFDSYRLALIGGAADHRGDPRAAEKFLSRAENFSPNDGSISFQFGQHYAALKQYTQAENYFRKTTQLLPEFSDGWIQLVEIEKALHNPTAAISALLQGLRLCPLSPALHLQMASARLAQGDTADAEKEFRESIRLRPEEPEPHLQLAQLYFQQERLEEGLNEVYAALRAEPDFPPALSTLAFYWISSGREKEAADALQKVRAQPRISPPDRQRLEDAFAQRFGRGP